MGKVARKMAALAGSSLDAYGECFKAMKISNGKTALPALVGVLGHPGTVPVALVTCGMFPCCAWHWGSYGCVARISVPL